VSREWLTALGISSKAGFPGRLNNLREPFLDEQKFDGKVGAVYKQNNNMHCDSGMVNPDKRVLKGVGNFMLSAIIY
jgi:hypothetical protein